MACMPENLLKSYLMLFHYKYHFIQLDNEDRKMINGELCTM